MDPNRTIARLAHLAILAACGLAFLLARHASRPACGASIDGLSKG